MQNSQKDLNAFAKAAHSLKLYRRADLRDDVTDKSLIKKLYVDPLQNEAVLETMLRDSTTFIVGRKGTGKSTIFQRAQHELRQRPNIISAYVDIKTVYESAEVDPAIPQQLAKAGVALPEDMVKRVLIYRAFIHAVFKDVKKELKAQISSTIFDKILARVGLRKSDVTSDIDELLEGSFEANLVDVTAFQHVDFQETTAHEQKAASESAKGGAIKVGAKGVGIDANGSKKDSVSEAAANSHSEKYSKILLKTININEIMERLQKLLSSIGISKLYIFIDDFSELPQEAMTVFVDTVLAPLNNWSNELIKFKVAGYPGRIYLGKIDPMKIDEVNLDMFRLYGEQDVGTMEEKAIDFTRRLVASRFNHYVGRDFSEFCDSDADGVYKQLFYATMANPRNLGHVLANLRDSVVAYQAQIGVRSVQEASTKYYEEKVEPFFGVQKFAHVSFDERASIFSLKELLETIVSRAKKLRDYKDSKVTREIRGFTSSSHFHVSAALDTLLATLELNFFITLYYEMKDRDGKKVAVYALNHGLCQKYGIKFGRPSGQREYRLYFIERIFDYTNILRKFLRSNQEIKCMRCGAVQDLETLPSLRLFDMLCPVCKKGTCEVINLSRKYEQIIRSVDPGLMLPATELGILEALFVEDRDMVASEIAGELDCSYQLIGRRGKNLSDRGLVKRDKNTEGRRVFNLTEEAKDDYFVDNESRTLDINTD